MIVEQVVMGEVRCSFGKFPFLHRNGNMFEAICPTEIVYDGGWAFLTPQTIEVCGDYIIEHSPRIVPVSVDANYINRRLEAAEASDGEMTWETKVEIDELLKEY